MVESTETEKAQVGLLAWLGATADHYTLQSVNAGATTRLVFQPGVANCFQIGCTAEAGPFLAYPRPFWWFAAIWRGITAGPMGLGLIMTAPESLVIVLPSSWPLALTEWAARCRERGVCCLIPWTSTYEATLGHPESRRPISSLDDLDQTREVQLIFEEPERWLNP